MDLWQTPLYTSSTARGNTIVPWEDNAMVAELLCRPLKLRKFSILSWLIFKVYHFSGCHLSLECWVSYPRPAQAPDCSCAEIKRVQLSMTELISC